MTAQVYLSGSGKSDTFGGKSVAVAVGIGVGLEDDSNVSDWNEVAVSSGRVGKGEMGIVEVGIEVRVGCCVCLITGVVSAQLIKKNTIKVKMTSLDEFNGIKGPFVTVQEVDMVLKYRPKIIVDWNDFGNQSVDL